MIYRRPPFQRWPLAYHALVAGLVAASLVSVGWWYLQSQTTTLAALQSQRETLQNQVDIQRRAVPSTVQVDFARALPSVLRADEVQRDISRFAQTLGVQISSLSVQTRPPSTTEIGKVNFNLVAQADYTACKTWLAELLGRYPSLGVQNLSMHAQANEGIRQDIRLSLVLFVKD
jgi:type IV pilus biogenesis protein CpaD/CtpE